jgi:hypothetical protein
VEEVPGGLVPQPISFDFRLTKIVYHIIKCPRATVGSASYMLIKKQFIGYPEAGLESVIQD